MAREQVIQIPVGRGAATGIDPSLSQRLQTAVGVVYRPGDPSAHKMGGRTAANSAAIGSPDRVRDVQFADSRVMAFTDPASGGSGIYRGSPASTGALTFSSLGTFDLDGQDIDIATLNDDIFLVSGSQSTTHGGGGITSPFGAYQVTSAGLVRLGLYTQFNAAVAVVGVAGALTGSYLYWVTEYDSTNAVESALTADVPPVSGVSPVAQKVDITKPTIVNPTADKWRIYRTIAGGTFPIGWLVAELDVATASYTDNTADADLVLNDEYRIVTINDIPESMDVDPQTLALTSIASFQGSLVGTTQGIGPDVVFTPAGEPHSWPTSYALVFPTTYSGSARCVRKCGEVLYVAFPSEMFLVNYLPDERDSIFDTNICIEHVANYGTPSSLGMCAFTAWGGQPTLFVASIQGPMLVSGKFVDRAVKAIDWSGTLSRPTKWTARDNPNLQRVEFYYQTTTGDSAPWECLHFYYDSERLTGESRPFPEMAWTGPHPVPGPGCSGYGSNRPFSWTAGSNASDGIVWLEESGTSDGALLTDSDGTIPFTLRTQRIYPAGTTGEAKCDRVFISKFGDGAQDYTLTLTRWREKHGEVQHRETPNIVISGTHDGINSHTLNDSVQGFDIEVNADGNTAMAPINNISVVLKDVHEGIKTVTV